MHDINDLIFTTVHGSHLYGLAHEGSDWDYFYVFEGKGGGMMHKKDGDLDFAGGSLDAVMMLAASGSHQSCEAIFSRQKKWAPGMKEKWGTYIESFRVTSPEAFEKYERTIHKFCFGDFKRRRHAIRLSYSLSNLRLTGRFNPELRKLDIAVCNEIATELEGEDLWDVLK